MSVIEYTRQRDWFDPSTTSASVTVVGCGGIGSFSAFALAKLGVQRFDLVDFDTVEAHNLPNQMYWPGHEADSKVEALASILANVNPEVTVVPHDANLSDGITINDVVVSALDSMEARAELFEFVKYKLACQLFIDARLAGEYIVLYCLNPSVPEQIEAYERTLHSDEEGLELPCTGRGVIDVGFAVGALITRAVRKHYAGESAQAITFFDISSLDLFKGDWS